MRLTEKIRHYWHDLYYYFASDRGVEFAMRCKDIAEQVDVKNPQATFTDRIRFNFHISLCQGCKNYLDTTKALRQAVQKAVLNAEKPARLKKLNKDLLTKHLK